MKKILLVFSVLITTVSLTGQKADTIPGPWKFQGMTSYTYSQVSLVNWAQGGDNNSAFNGIALLNLYYTKNKSSWTNTLDMGYGTQKVDGRASGKTDDHFDFLSKYGYKTGKNWYISVLLDIRSQFTEGYKVTSDTSRTLISDFMSPGYLQLALGMEYKPNDKFYFMLSPIGVRETFVLNDSLSAHGAFGVDPGKKIRTEMGASARISITHDIMKNVTLTTSMDLFSNLLDKPQNVDVNWRALIDMKINKFLSANFSLAMVYDDNIKSVDNEGVVHGPKIQLKELIGVGFSFKFISTQRNPNLRKKEI
jgi:hypothetical protein